MQPQQQDPYTQKWFTFCPHCQNRLEVKERRATCSKCDFVFYHNPAPCVAVIIAKDNQILLAKRAIAPQKDTWDALGGFVNAGETPEAAVLREVKEETSLDVRITKYLGTYPDIYGETQVYTLNFFYVVEIISGVPQPADDVAELKWFSYDKPPKDLAFENTRKIVHWYQKFKEEKHAV